MRTQTPLPHHIRAAGAKAVRVRLGWQLAEGALTLIATTLKRGATYSDRWFMSPSLELVAVTVVNTSARRESRYVSEAGIAACALAPDTTYTFSYAIVMQAATHTWAGSCSVAVTVGPDGSPVPAEAAGGAEHRRVAPFFTGVRGVVSPSPQLWLRRRQSA